ncbi:MAG: type II toxin-antitoxin system VapC family toxin [Treponemataceae bacterium]|nr:MAG: type II toxin-antitoxin system VapC family toxin [Treponemataceae bacterium]
MLIDSDVLIRYIQGNKNAQTAVNKNMPFQISVVTYMEVIQGMKDKTELKIFQKYLKKWPVRIIQIDENISTRAMFLMEDYSLTHSLELGEAIIASTALENQEILLTGNDKHYKFIPNMQIQKFKP